MSIEIEKKYRLTDDRRAAIEADLREAGAEYIGRDHEENTIYSSETLREKGGVVRIRRTETTSKLTFKKRIENESDVKHQIEHETEIGDPGEVNAILNELGLSPVLVYEKRRDTWKFRSVEVVIDELPFGLYMEIEGSLTSIKEAEMLLDIEDLETEPKTYPRLTMKFGTDVDGVVAARFVAK